ncbi:MAG TPA: molybdenum cofactor guanylyltransferase [Gemmatales bacterium]|nr:molybdenum cofactor guanylyltransferase [Gemmatales bacterium]
MNPFSQNTISVNSSVTGIILAGGASRRMGRAKALLPWGNSTLLQHLTNTLVSRVDPFIIVSNGQMALPTLPLQVQLVNDTIPHQGPLAGFSHGLKVAPEDRPVFLTGCDFPFIQPSIIDYLLDQLEGADAIVAQSANILQPLIGLYQSRIIHTVNHLIETGTRSLTALLEMIDCKTISEAEWRRVDPSCQMLVNINTPEEYELAHQHYLKITSSIDCS